MTPTHHSDSAIEKKRASGRRWYENHREEVRAKQGETRAAIREDPIASAKATEYQKRYYKENRDRILAQTKKYNSEHTEGQAFARKRWKLRTRYGITPKIYEEMLEAQGGVCAICGAVPREKSAASSCLHVDHDHKTGEVRGLLCISCNRAVGWLHDDVTLLKSAVEYLEKLPDLVLK